MVGVISGFTLVQRKPRLSLVIDENFTLFSIKNSQLVSHFCTFILFYGVFYEIDLKTNLTKFNFEGESIFLWGKLACNF
jgi:hypothetical protein